MVFVYSTVSERHGTPWNDSLRRIARPPGTNGREELVVRNVANPISLSCSLAHGNFFGRDHDACHQPAPKLRDIKRN